MRCHSLVFVVALVVSVGLLSGQRPTTSPANINTALTMDPNAENAITQFMAKAASTGPTTQRSGIGPGGNPWNFSDTKRGEPFALFNLSTSDLIKARPGPNNPLIMHTPSHFVVPLVAKDGTPLSALKVDLAKGKWLVAECDASEDLELVKARDKEAKLEDKPKANFHIVQIRSLNASFICGPEGDKAKLKAIDNVDSAGIEAGAVLSPTDALEKLRDAAIRYNGMPG